MSKKRKREAEEGGDALKSLENTTLGSKIEIAALDEMKSMEVLALVILFYFDYLGTDGILRAQTASVICLLHMLPEIIITV